MAGEKALAIRMSFYAERVEREKAAMQEVIAAIRLSYQARAALAAKGSK